MFAGWDTWAGEYTELLCLYRDATEELTEPIQHAVWSWPSLFGPFACRHIEPEDQPLVSPSDERAQYGVVTLPGETGRVAFRTHYIVDSDGLWLYAGMPEGSLCRVVPAGPSLGWDDGASRDWMFIIHDVLFGLAGHLHQRIPFERAVVGSLLTIEEVSQLAERSIPKIRWHSYMTTADNELIYHPSNSLPPTTQ